MRLLARLEPIRRWVDGGDDVDVAELINRREAPCRIGEAFLVKVAREVSCVLDYEAFTPPGGLTYIPGEFIVFLSAEDDEEWQGAKRQGLQQGLAYALGQRALELFGRNHLSKSSFAIDLRVDGTLEKGEFRVKAIWDSEANKTLVTPRKFDNQLTLGRTLSDDELTVVNARPRAVFYCGSVS